jgi:hypothetical protein
MGGGTLALNSDGSRAVCGFVYPHGAKVWDTHSGECVATLSPENSVVEFSPDDRWIAAGGRSQYQLFRAGDFQELWRVAREGALLTAGYAAAVAAAVASAPNGDQVTAQMQTELEKSFSSAEQMATQYPQYAAQITAGAKQSFLDGDQWAYTAGIVAILLGAAVVATMFPHNDDERRLLAQYHAEDTGAGPASTRPATRPA